ncbi:SPOR domain-containing protein [Pseudoalteromonas tunicata]|uniref:SPOR domain-containing protein n=1 Tax=Pseudoalteromonas tunicata TaxID=314281 RepID=UPI00273EF616|nr:SPOR domain-containing protein [Pseudoalteromonas tunicata]MDP4985338.1 SPOR domain-containing protein [Pseudoalteromonas tunicata]
MFDKMFTAPAFIFVFFLLLGLTQTAYASTFEKIELNEDEYILVDVRIRDWNLLSDIDIYRFDDVLYVPALSIIQALELQNTARLNDGFIQVVIGSSTRWVDLNQKTANIKLSDKVRWSSNGLELLVAIDLLAELLDANLEYQSTMLRLSITPRNEDFQFPIEKRMNRKLDDSKTQYRATDLGPRRYFSSQEVLLDHYHLLTPPTGNVGLNMYTTDTQTLGYALNTSLSSDFLYHSATLNLTKGINRDLRGNIRFSGAPKSPYDIMPLGIDNYEFGDITLSGTGSSVGGRGVGIAFRSSERNFSRNFGTTVIEGDANPGWEAELYVDGFFVSQQKVTETGRYFFENVPTEFGINTYKVKLFGPYGEEDERIETIDISGNWLKPGNTRFKGGAISQNTSLLHNDLSESLKLNNVYYGFDYGLTEMHQLGVTLGIANKEDEENQRELQLTLQSGFQGLLINNRLKIDQRDLDYSLAGQGRITNNYNYNFNYNYFRLDYKNTLNNLDTIDSHSVNVGFSGRSSALKSLFYGMDARINKNSKGTELSAINMRFSTSVESFNFYNYLTYQPQSKSEGDDFGNEKYTGAFGWSADFFEVKNNLSVNYNYQDSIEFESLDFSYYTDLAEGYFLSGKFEYNAKTFKDDGSVRRPENWVFGAGLTKSFEHYNLNGSFEYNSDDHWAIGIGINFSLGYDHVNNQVKVSSSGLYGGANLDLTAYLDRNSNNILDENDLALSDVEFGPYVDWKEYKTGPSGRVVIQGVPTNSVVGFSGAWGRGVQPTVPSYSLYTHSGGYIKANIPFTIKSDLIGYLYIAMNDEEQAVKDAVIELVGANGEVVRSAVTAHDGYYDFNGINAGDYYIRVSPQFLAQRGLKSEPGAYHFPTPPQGGFVEAQSIILYPMAADVAINSIKEIELTEFNYDPAIEKSKLGLGIFVKPQQVATKIKAPVIKAPKLKSATVVKPFTTSSTLPVVNFEEVQLKSQSNLGLSAQKSVNEPTIDNVVTQNNINAAAAQNISENAGMAEAETAPQAVVTDAVDTRWAVQLASYQNKNIASSDLALLKQQLTGVNLQLIEDKTLFKIVQLGFSSVIEASNAAKKIKDKYNFDAFAIELPLMGMNELPEPLLSQAKFSIQLAALKSQKLALDMIKRLPENQQYYTAQHNGNFLVLLGLFSERNQAEIHKSKLDNSLNGWIKSLEAVTEIKAFN